MTDVPITVACGNYDRTKAIKDGQVKVDGCAPTYLPLYPEEIFHRVFRYQEFDVAEISFSSYMRTVADGPRPISVFRRSCRVSSVIPGSTFARMQASATPEDFRGKRIGVPEYQITAVVWMRGMMQHEYGVTPTEIHWHHGGQEQPGRGERTQLKAIPGLDLQAIPDAARSSERTAWPSCRPTRSARLPRCRRHCCWARSIRCCSAGLPETHRRPAPADRHGQRAVPAVRAGRRPAVATWNIAGGQVVLAPFAPLDTQTQAALAADAADVMRFLGQ